MFQNGRFGQDVVIRVPPGTVVQEQILDDTGAVIRTIDLGTLIDGTDDDSVGGSSRHKSTLLVARGGSGGEGSAAAGRHRGSSRRPREPPQGGQRKTLMLTLKIVADVALVGVPNAGKSTFLAAVTRYVVKRPFWMYRYRKRGGPASHISLAVRIGRNQRLPTIHLRP
jgi:GTPase